MAEYTLTFGEAPTSDDKLFGTLAHLSTLVSSFVGPLLIVLLIGDKAPYIKYHAMQALGLQAALWVGGTVAGSVIAVISFLTCGFGSLLGLLAIPLIPVLMLAPLWGAWLAWEGRWAGYPMMESIGR